MKNTEIKIRHVLTDKTGTPAYVEFHSYTDSRNHIIRADRFCEIFGYTAEELEEIDKKPSQINRIDPKTA